MAELSLTASLLGAAICVGAAKYLGKCRHHGEHGGPIALVILVLLYVFAAALALGAVKAVFVGSNPDAAPSAPPPPSMAAPTQYAPPPSQSQADPANPYLKPAKPSDR